MSACPADVKDPEALMEKLSTLGVWQAWTSEADIGS